MKNRGTAFALAALCATLHGAPKLPSFADGQSQRFSDVPVDMAAEKLDVSGQLSIASGNVQISYGETTIFADEAQYDPSTRDVIASGNVRIYREGQVVTAERAVYNLETKDILSASVAGDNMPFMYSAGTFQNNQEGRGYQVKGGTFTTSDSLDPGWALRARRVRLYPDESVTLYDVDLCFGDTVILRLPYLYQSLDRENSLSITPGYRSVWGGYLLTNYTFPLTDRLGATLRMDYLSKRGFGAGLSTQWQPREKNGRNWGRFTTYGIQDSGTNINQTALAREAVTSSRYRLSLQARQYLTDDIYASVNINKLSDARFLQDFFEGEFLQNPQPDNVVSVTKLSDDYALTFIARKQLNEFFEGTERLPEVALDFTRQPFFRSKVFYEGQTSAGHYRRNYESTSTVPDYGFTRVDSFHQFTLPQTYLGWLSVVPRAGIRGTWYSESGTVQQVQTTTTQQLTDGTQQLVTTTLDRLLEGGPVFRPVFNAGVEASFKASKAFENVQSRAWGLDGMRHIVQPYLNLSYVNAGKDGTQLLQIDRFQRSSQLPAIDFPTFNSIDSINDWNVLRLGMRNRLQTRRDDSTFNWLELDSFFDVRFKRPVFAGLEPDPGTFSNFVNRLRWTPLPWVSLQMDAQLPLLDTGFTEVNSDVIFMLNKRTSLNIGHRYLNDNILLQDSSRITFGAHYRMTENWAFSMRGFYENRDNTLEQQVYEVHRDLSSWVASLGFIARNNGTGDNPINDYGVILTFTLKDLPNVRLPVSFDPSGSGTNGSSANP